MTKPITEGATHGFSGAELEQLKELAHHMNYVAPLPKPDAAEKRLRVDVLIYNAVGEASVVIEVYNDGRDPLIFFPNQAEEAS